MDIKKLETAISNIDEKYILEAAKYIKDSNYIEKNECTECMETGEYIALNEETEIGEDTKISQHSETEKKRQYKRVRTIRRIAACFIAAIILSMPTLAIATAAGNMPAYDILYSLYPEIAKKLTPINLSCIDNGIKMEVEAVDIENDTANIYISMKDLEGNRIDETMDLFDSYYILSSSDSIATWSRMDYNVKEKKATFLIQQQHMYGKKITRKKLTFGVTEFLSGKHKMDEELPEIKLESMEIVWDTQQDVDIRGGSGKEDMGQVTRFLKRNESISFSPIDGVTVTAYGFVDGKLHFQTYYENIHETDNHGYIYFKDKDGNIIHSDVSIAFWDEEHRGSYQEDVFDISPEDELTDYTVWGYFRTCSNLTKGNWEVTFPVEETEF